jgi:hypothetical protein
MPRSPDWRHHAWGAPGAEIIPSDFLEIWLALWEALGAMDD